MENIKVVFEELVDEVVDAMEDVACAFELGSDVKAARDRLRKSRQALREFFAEQIENR